MEASGTTAVAEAAYPCVDLRLAAGAGPKVAQKSDQRERWMMPSHPSDEARVDYDAEDKTTAEGLQGGKIAGAPDRP